MGMFDLVRCKYKLPDPEVQDAEFQTKDIDCCSGGTMSDYEITEDGRLIHKKYEYRERERKKDGSWWDNFPCIERIDDSLELIDQNFHGYFVFYTRANDKWYEYQAKFTDGKIVEIKRIQENVIA